MHWCEQHPTFQDGGLALSTYQGGTKFLNLAKDGKITEKPPSAATALARSCGPRWPCWECWA
jgi:hypothetical protein